MQLTQLVTQLLSRHNNHNEVSSKLSQLLESQSKLMHGMNHMAKKKDTMPTSAQGKYSFKGGSTLDPWSTHRHEVSPELILEVSVSRNTTEEQKKNLRGIPKTKLILSSLLESRDEIPFKGGSL